MTSSHIVMRSPTEPPELPWPYFGCYELWMGPTPDLTLVCLDVWAVVKLSASARWVRSFTGKTPDDALYEFNAWLSGLQCQQVFG